MQLPPVDVEELEKEELEQKRLQRIAMLQQQTEKLQVRQRPVIVPSMVVARMNQQQVPPTGNLERPPLVEGQQVREGRFFSEHPQQYFELSQAFAMRGNILNIWKSGTVVDVFKSGSTPTYRLKFDVKDARGKVVRTQSKVLMSK